LGEGLLVLDAGLRVVAANHSFYQVSQVFKTEVEGRLFHDLGNRQWNIPQLHTRAHFPPSPTSSTWHSK
jgi:two-component system CheB/CheR fusion protein